MKILFVGDVSNLHNTLSHALKGMGHDCIVITNGNSWQQTDKDISLVRKAGTFGTVKYFLDLSRALLNMRGYDIVHIIAPHFLTLRPEKLAKVLAYLKRYNKHVFYSACCTDYYYLTACHDGNTFKYSDFLIGDTPSPYVQSPEWNEHSHWNLPEVVEYQKHFVNQVDGIVACLYEYYMSYNGIAPQKLCYAGIPIDTRELKLKNIGNTPDKVRFFIGIQKAKNILKGTDRMLDALKRVCERYPSMCEMVVAENVPYKQYVEMMRSSHVILDQLYSYTPATNALIAMAQGLVAVSGAEPEYYKFINEPINQPIINVSPLKEDDIYNKLEWLVLNKNYIPNLALMSRDFVVKHNDSRLVAQRHINFWNKFITK